MARNGNVLQETVKKAAILQHNAMADSAIARDAMDKAKASELRSTMSAASSVLQSQARESRKT